MDIHYFQRYHQQENAETANTMLLLSRLYHYNSNKFYDFINSLFFADQNNFNLDPTFGLQVSNKNNQNTHHSVLDAEIKQESFDIVVETKRRNDFDKNQLINHLYKIAEKPANINVLLTLGALPMKEQLKKEIDTLTFKFGLDNKINVRHVNITFEQLILAMDSTINEDRDYEMSDILNDYRKYCMEAGMLSNAKQYMRAVTAGTTFSENIELNLYYCNTRKNISEHGYLGLYYNKSIHAIGKLIDIIHMEVNDGIITYKNQQGLEPSEDVMERIKKAIKFAENHGYNLLIENHNYYIVDKFYLTDFKKDTNYPIQRDKFFNVYDMLKIKDNYDLGAEELASNLNGKEWSAF